MIETSAAAKIILFGEHAVVHGQPAIAIPFSTLRTRVSMAKRAPAFELRSAAGDLLVSLESPQDSDPQLLALMHVILQQLGIEAPAVMLSLSSDIPPASGLGSGAAISAALARALARVTSVSLENERLNEIVYATEKLFHGTPSGIDNTVVVHEKAICFTRGRAPLPIQVACPLRLLVADSGQRCATHIPVSAVRDLLLQEPGPTGERLAKIGQIVRHALVALASSAPDAIGPLMNRNHALLRELDVSSLLLDRLVDAAMEAGASGAKLSGAGRGGNMIALVNEATEASVSRALSAAGAVRVLATTVPTTG